MKLRFNVLVASAIAAPLFFLPQAPAQAQATDTMRIAITSPMQSLYPPKNAGTLALALLKTVYEPLTRVREDGSVEALLATSWAVDPDGKSWVIKLREGVKFHDGTPFNAAAVHANFTRLLDPKRPIASPATFGSVNATEVIDEYTIRIKSAQPFSGLPIALSHGMGAMVSPKSIADGTTERDDHAAAGTGAFKIESFKLPDEIVLGRNDDYWGTKPKMRRLQFLTRSDDQTRLAALLSNEADVNVYITADGQQRVEADPNLKVIKVDSIRAFIVHLPMNVPEMQDKRVRMALNLAIDRNQIVKTIFQGAAVPVDSSIGPGVFGYRASQPYPYDLAKATALLKEAGWAKDGSGMLAKDGKPFPTISFIASRGRVPNDARLAQVVAGYLRALGVPTTLQIDEFATFWAAANAATKVGTTMVQTTWGFTQMDGTAFLCTVYGPAQYNFGAYKSPLVDKACNDINATFDSKQREALIIEATKAVYEDAPAIFLVVPSYLIGARKNATGIVFNAGENHLFAGAAFQ